MVPLSGQVGADGAPGAPLGAMPWEKQRLAELWQHLGYWLLCSLSRAWIKRSELQTACDELLQYFTSSSAQTLWAVLLLVWIFCCQTLKILHSWLSAHKLRLKKFSDLGRVKKEAGKCIHVIFEKVINPSWNGK